MKTKVLKIFSFCFFMSGLFICESCHKDRHEPTVPPPVRVNVMVINPSTQGSLREYSGTVASSSVTTLSFSVPGTIATLNVKEGQRVSKGQVLGILKAGDLENARNMAEAQLAEAQDGYNRLKKLHDANALPDVKWVEIQQKLKQAENAMAIANRSLQDATMISPVSGTIGKRYAEPGQSVVPVQPIFDVVSTDALEVEVPIGETEISGIAIAQKAKISFDAPGLMPIDGKVTTKSVVADPLTRSYTVKIGIPDSNGKILPGMIASVIFEDDNQSKKELSGEIVLPRGVALLNHDNRWFVWLVKDNTATRCFVEVDELVDNGILVKKGLQSGDTVIIAGMQKVGTGTKVDPLMN